MSAKFDLDLRLFLFMQCVTQSVLDAAIGRWKNDGLREMSRLDLFILITAEDPGDCARAMLRLVASERIVVDPKDIRPV